jgi:hypothetical protein
LAKKVDSGVAEADWVVLFGAGVEAGFYDNGKSIEYCFLVDVEELYIDVE